MKFSTRWQMTPERICFTLSLSLLLLLFLFSCSKKVEVAGPKFDENIRVPLSTTHLKLNCAGHHNIRPKVDFLFLWDNTGSANFIRSETRLALQNALDQISPRFDYHALMAPLKVSSSANSPLFLMVDNTEGLSTAAKGLIIANDQHGRLEAFKQIGVVGGAQEMGLQRVLDVVGQNKANGIFREEAYTVIVLMSNNEDNGCSIKQGNYCSYIGENGVLSYLNGKKLEMEQLAQSLKSQQFRFISVVAHSTGGSPSSLCPAEGHTEGRLYKMMSEHFYSKLPPPYRTPFDDKHKDSYDLCSTGPMHIFDGLNQTIQDILVKHSYNYWPLASTQDPAFDPQKIRVWKNTQVDSPLLENDPNGFSYEGFLQNHPTRILPTEGEEKTGHLIKLHGNAVVTFPECVHVQTQVPADFFGFVVLDKNPNLETIEVEINGVKIPRDQTNGWSFVGYHSSKNIKIKSRSDLAAQEPGLSKSGYFLQMKGSAIYTNGDVVNFSYRPAPL